jgi:hypothetical protein
MKNQIQIKSKLGDFSLLIKSKILDSCLPAYRQAGAGMTAIAQ